MCFVTLTPESLGSFHICCAISDRKCADGYAAKKAWLAAQFEHGYRFRRLDARGKVFIEFGPAETAWMPVEADGWLMLGCFRVSGQFKGQGHAKALLADAVAEARNLGLKGVVSVVGKSKFHFMSDGKWLMRQGFVEADAIENGFSLLALDIDEHHPAGAPRFAQSARVGVPSGAKPITVYYSDRCPFTDFHVNTSLRESCEKRGLEYEAIKLTDLDAAKHAPSPATIFSLFVNGKFVTTDLSACMDTRFDKIVSPALYL